MSLLTNLFRLIAPTHPAGFCPTSYQEYTDAIINGTQITFLIDTGNFLYNYGNATPAPENRIFPWLNTNNGLWYTFQFGLWVSPMDPGSREADFRKMWKPPTGTLESAIWSVDGGDGTDPSITPPTQISGAAWQVDHDMDGIFPVGVGTIPGSSDSITLGQTGGEYEHTLTEAEGAVGQHVHAVGKWNVVGDDAFFVKTPQETVTSYGGQYITGSGPNIPQTLTVADIFTLPANLGAGAVSDPFKIYPKYRGIYWVKPTAKIFYTLPA